MNQNSILPFWYLLQTNVLTIFIAFILKLKNYNNLSSVKLQNVS